MPKKNCIALFFLFAVSTQIHPALNLHINDSIKFINNSFAYGPLLYDSYKELKESIPYLFNKKYQRKNVVLLKKYNDTLSHALKNEIRNVLKECNITQADTIPILECIDFDCPAAIHEGPIVLIDANQYMALSPDMRRACIGHEAMHIKNNDVHNDLLFTIALPLLVYATVKAYTTSSNAFLNSIKKTTQNDKTKTTAKNLILLNSIAANFFQTKLLLADLLEALYFKHSEKRADLESVQTLNNAKDAINLYEHALEENGENNSIFAHHPSFKDRLAYLAKYVKIET